MSKIQILVDGVRISHFTHEHVIKVQHLKSGPMTEILAKESVQIGPQSVPVWPDGLALKHLDPLVCATVFPDNDVIRAVLEPKLLEAERKFRDGEPDRWEGGGGAKIRDIGSWDCPAMKLLNARALAAFRKITGSETAFIDDVWGNVYRKGDFIGPHGHRRTEVSVVYHLVPPNEEDRKKFNGALGITDPRVARCCPTAKGLVTSQVYPPLNPGTMVLFPSFVTHYVTPHTGDEHRISLAWNIDRKDIPGHPLDEPLL